MGKTISEQTFKRLTSLEERGLDCRFFPCYNRAVAEIRFRDRVDYVNVEGVRICKKHLREMLTYHKDRITEIKEITL